jgi:tRNA A-37 threonylcarbamoyl transferase component Bud32
VDKIGRYRIDRVLGSGAFATVWLGHDDELDVDVAIKILAENWVHDEDVRKRFLEEARILWRAQSPNIVRIHHIDVLDDGRPYLVMALADRGSLEDRMRERAVNRRQFTVAEAVEISLGIATGLEAAHALDIVHRDLKPSAVLFQSIPGADEPQLVLADFGIAKSIAQSKTTVATGTPHYMAPEQAEGRVDQRTDVYSAAVILYELLAGRVPYAFDSLAEVIRAQATAPPVSISLLRPDTPPALGEALAKALARNPDDRFSSATEWKNALIAATTAPAPAPETAPAAAPGTPEPAPEPPLAATMTAEQFMAAQAAAAPTGSTTPPPPAPPPATGATPPPPPPSRRKKRGMLWPLLGLGALAALIVGGLVFLTGGDEEGPDITEVFAEPVASTGIDPFTPSLVPSLAALPSIPAVDTATIERVVDLLNPPVGDLSPIDFPDLGIPGIELPGVELPQPGSGDVGDVADAVVATVSGAAPGLYGGTEILNTCDKEALIAFMQDNLDKATAWAGVQGIDVADIPEFVRGLTDVILQVDTRVTNHGFRNGVANPINSVLQAGTAVLVDTFGIPRVRCYCGNPLEPAVALSVDVTVHGTTWPGFDLNNTVVVQAIEEILDFTLDDILGALQFIKPAGAAATPPATTTTAPPATTTTVVLGTGDVQATLRWSGDADLDLHVIDPDGVEIYFENARSPSGGTLDVDMVPQCGATGNNVENVFWPEGGSIPGVYQAFVVHYGTSCATSAGYELELKIDGEVVASDSGTLAVGEASAPISATGG